MKYNKKQPHQNHANRKDEFEAPLPKKAYPLVDTDLGRDNIENDLPEADRQDLDNL